MEKKRSSPDFLKGYNINTYGWVGELKMHAAASRMVPSIYGKGGEKGEGKSQCCNSVPLLFGLYPIYASCK